MPPRPGRRAHPPGPRLRPVGPFLRRGCCCRAEIAVFFILWIVLVVVGGEILNNVVEGDVAFIYIGIYSLSLLFICFFAGYFCRFFDDGTPAERAPMIRSDEEIMNP